MPGRRTVVPVFSMGQKYCPGTDSLRKDKMQKGEKRHLRFFHAASGTVCRGFPTAGHTKRRGWPTEKCRTREGRPHRAARRGFVRVRIRFRPGCAFVSVFQTTDRDDKHTVGTPVSVSCSRYDNF